MSDDIVPKLKFGRGLLGAVVAAFATAAMVVALSFAFLLCRWALTNPSAFDREYDLKDLLSWLPRTTYACTILGTSAGWATFATHQKHSYARTLIVIIFGTLALESVISLFVTKPRRIKGMEHPFLYPAEAILSISIPVVVTIALTIYRLRKKHSGSNEQIN